MTSASLPSLPSLPTLDDAAALAERLRAAATESGLKLWNLASKTLVPVVQGGMGVGVSAGGLAGTVARMGGIGTISSIDLRRLHPDLMEQTRPLYLSPCKQRQREPALEALTSTRRLRPLLAPTCQPDTAR